MLLPGTLIAFTNKMKCINSIFVCTN